MNKQDLIYLGLDVIQYSLNGLAQGSLYALLALGYTMVYGIVRLVNFAHGEFLMAGALSAFYAQSLHLPPLGLFLVAGLVSGGVALMAEYLIYRPLRTKDRSSSLISAIGLSLLFQYGAQLLFGASPKTIEPFIQERIYQWGELSINNIQGVIFAVTLTVMISLWVLINKTKLGKAMRAVSFNLEAAELMGINTQGIISSSFFIGAFIAGVSGVLMSYTIPVEPTMGTMLGMKAFVSAVVGGIGSIPGAFLGGLLVGVLENLVGGLYKNGLRDIVSFLLLILILLIKPAGLLGHHGKEKA